MNEHNANVDAHRLRALVVEDEWPARNYLVELIEAKKAAGTALLGIFHDIDVRDRVATRIVDVTGFATRRDAA